MGGATLTMRLWTLLSYPIPYLHPGRRPSSILLLRRLDYHHSSSLSLSLFTPFSLPPSSSSFVPPPKCSHTQARHLNSNGLSIPTPHSHHHPSPFPWPEFSDFIQRVSASGYSNTPLDVSLFVGSHLLDSNFLRDATSSLSFARDHPTLLWSLPREDIEVVVKNGSPFLFTNASAAMARMNSFLGHHINDVSQSDKPSTADLVEFLLSYAHMTIEISENMQLCSRVESSVRKLFSELAKFEGSSVESIATAQKQFYGRYMQAPRPFAEKVEMKKGDWICTSCSFMNFAKNSQCLQCEKLRPRNYVSGEWECPQCDFLNFSRNVVCLRCDCKKPGVSSFPSPTSVSASRADISSVKGNTDEVIAQTVEEQQWFTKIVELEKSSEMNSALEDEDFPETMKAGDNRFAARKGNSGGIDNPGPSISPKAGVENSINLKISQSLDELTGEKSSPSAISSFVSSQYDKHSEPRSGHDTYTPVQQQMSNEKSSSQIENNDYEREEAEKSERWFEKVAELHDVEDLPSATSDDDFPEIMPMRKGENRFVVSKKKDRSLTSPMYKRRVAMEQAGNSNYVPFVPFPPGYFAEDRPREGSESMRATEPTDAMTSDVGGTGERKEGKHTDPVFEASNNVNQKPKYIDSQFSSRNDYSNSRSSSEDARVKDSWRERSLEGSAVKEPDPLDMAEEAKAERWFRRVAQIKDISELSQIPDEDFPSIMPMRKGVNRFVVSKRKTPLERRLTSSQYRRNLPVVSSDPVRKETDSN